MGTRPLQEALREEKARLEAELAQEEALQAASAGLHH